MISPEIESEFEELEAWFARDDEFDDYGYDYDDEPEGLRVCVMCGVDLDADWDDPAFTCDDCDAESEVFDRHAANRDAKRARASGMQVSGRSIKSVILPVLAKRAREERRKGGRNAS